jgi:hypothetical protein
VEIVGTEHRKCRRAERSCESARTPKARAASNPAAAKRAQRQCRASISPTMRPVRRRADGMIKSAAAAATGQAK